MLKAWAQNQSLAEIEIEERYRTWVANLRTDKYVTVRTLSLQSSSCSSFDFVNWYCFVLFCPQVTLFQLQKIYGKSGEAKAFYPGIDEGCLVRSTCHCYWIMFSKIPNNMLIHPSHSGQAGVPHPQAWVCVLSFAVHPWFFALAQSWQAPNARGARMFKVLKEVTEENSSGSKSENSVPYLNQNLVYILDR